MAFPVNSTAIATPQASDYFITAFPPTPTGSSTWRWGTPTTTHPSFPTASDLEGILDPRNDPPIMGQNLTYISWQDDTHSIYDIYNCSFAPPRPPTSDAAVVMNLNSFDEKALYDAFLNCTRERDMRTFDQYGNASFVRDNYFGGVVGCTPRLERAM
jgi:hypothetical protein